MVRVPHGRPGADGPREDVVVCNQAVLDTDGRRPRFDERGRDLHSASTDERMAFVAEAPVVIRAFRDMLDNQARSLSETARRATKIVPR